MLHQILLFFLIDSKPLRAELNTLLPGKSPELAFIVCLRAAILATLWQRYSVLISQMETLRLREVERLQQGHSEAQPGSLVSA